MSKKCQLIMVTGQNNNKFYNMEECGDTINVTYGRVGCKEMTASYPASKWQSLYNSKIKKGYTDITELKSELKINNVKEIEDAQVKAIVDYLISKARTKIENNYLVSYKNVTEKQIQQAQNILDSILEYKTKYVPVRELNNRFLELYKIIPRKMKNVKDYLLESFDTSRLKEMLKEEQDLLDTMATQVKQNQNDSDDKQNDKTILEQAGITMIPASDDEIKLILDKLGKNANQFVRAFKVSQEPNNTDFENHLSKAKNKKTELFWHGSRTENWWSILSTGLRIRPTNAVYTGSMFGDGLYFADKAQKSIGYTSLSGSYWARGSEKRAFLCLYEVHVGKQKIVKKHTSECYSFNANNIDADSVYAQAGVDLRNNEYIVYNPHQCRPKYLVEIKG